MVLGEVGDGEHSSGAQERTLRTNPSGPGLSLHTFAGSYAGWKCEK